MRTKNKIKKSTPFYFAVTGTFHGSLISAKSEGEARRMFHKFYKGESITNIEKRYGVL